MNKVLASAGLLALGAAAVYGYDPEMTRAKTGRFWTVSATVRGFYDDNPTTSPSKVVTINPVTGIAAVTEPNDSFGVEVSPSVHINLPLEQTFIRAGYVYSLRYFEDREPDNEDQSHEFNALLRHAFSPRHDISVADSFIYSSEPTVIDKAGIVTAPTRTKESAAHNHGAIDYNLGLTKVLGLGLGYANEFYDYDNEARSALLDRLEHYIHADLRYQVNPKLVGLVGYQLGIVNYTADAKITATEKSDIRDSLSHYVYVGADYDITQKLRASARVGGQFIDYDNANEDDLSPYADASLEYAYAPGSSAKVGIKHHRAATDAFAVDANGDMTLDQEVTALYVSVTHQITTDLSGNVIGQVQNGTFNGGPYDDDNETFFLVGLNLAYRIDQHWGLEAGYNFDRLDSDVNRSFSRNRVYLGVRATY